MKPTELHEWVIEKVGYESAPLLAAWDTTKEFKELPYVFADHLLEHVNTIPFQEINTTLVRVRQFNKSSSLLVFLAKANVSSTQRLTAILLEADFVPDTMMVEFNSKFTEETKRPTKMKLGRFLTSILQLDEVPAHSLVLLRKIEIEEIQVQFIGNDDDDGWVTVYNSPYIRSCMNNSCYGVAEFETCRAYATLAHGLEDNGLRLAYLGESPKEALARAIITEYPEKCYATTYGRHQIAEALEKLGYKRNYSMLDGVFIAGLYDAHGERLLCPYVDNIEYCNIEYSKQGPILRLLQDDGDYSAQATSGYLEERKEYCPACDSDVHGEVDNPIYCYRNGHVEEEFVCSNCVESTEEVRYLGGWVNWEGPICCVDGYAYANEWENLAYYGINYVERYDEFYMDCVYSEYDDAYIPENEAVFLKYLNSYYWKDLSVEVDGHWFIQDHVEKVGDDEGNYMYIGTTPESQRFLEGG